MSEKIRLDSYRKRFKAGDFTSGKMGEIYKTVFMDSKTVSINHKVFGDCYMLPISDLKNTLNFMLGALFQLECHRDQNGKIVVIDSREYVKLASSESLQKLREPLIKVFKENIEGCATDFDYYRLIGETLNQLYALEMDLEQ